MESAYAYLRELLTDLADYLDYLHVQNVIAQNPSRISFDAAKKDLDLE